MYASLKQVETFFESRRMLGIKPGLERMSKMLEIHNNPHKYIKAIHIAGTNGKGSTLTFINAALINNNYQVGVFTSPSMTGLTGHILINDQAISEDQFLAIFNQLLPTIEQLDSQGLHPTEFEIITVIAYIYFKNRVDIAIIETGMGGRDDSTNCIQPIVSIITNIATDHATFLGNTLEKIAYQKAGIIKKDTPVVIGEVDEQCLSVILKEAEKTNSVVYQFEKDFLCKRVSSNSNGQIVGWSSTKNSYHFSIQMHGMHQISNVGIAMMALELVANNHLSLNWDHVLTGIYSATILGRFEKINTVPPIILDGAHNPEGMKVFLATVQEFYENREKTLVFAGFRDKELHKMLQMALPYFNKVIVTTFNHPRAEFPEKIINGIHSDRVIISDWKETIRLFEEQNHTYFFAGSLHFISVVRSFIKDYY